MRTFAIESGHEATAERQQVSRAAVVKLFVAFACITFLLRIFYAGHLFQDDGLWFTAAEEMLRGKALYREIYFDKPPVLPLVYALLFKLFGAHIIVIRLFGIFYSVAISAVLYLFGAWLYDRRTGLFAAAMFTLFSTTYLTGHMQGLNSDFLMALPYTAGAYLLVRSRADVLFSGRGRRRSAWLALAGGALAGIAFQVNPKAVFDILFFALFLLIARRWGKRGAVSSLALALAGFAAASLPFLFFLSATGSLPAYRAYVWDWGARYSGYYPFSELIGSALRQTAGYFALNNTLLITLAFVIGGTIKQAKGSALEKMEPAAGAGSRGRASFRQDVTLLVWLAASFAGIAVGGRFFGHYFFQILPGLCLIGARGLTLIALAMRSRKPGQRRAIVALLALGFIFTLVRFHGRTIVLASDWVRGTRSNMTSGWLHERLNREERVIAAVVREMPGAFDAANRIGAEALRADSPRNRALKGPSDYLFVWGYRPDIYFWSGLLPASPYLSSQPLTGVPADVHFRGDDFKAVLDEASTAAARAELARDLEAVRPTYIIDELGMYNGKLAIKSYPEFKSLLEGYERIRVPVRFLVYRSKDGGANNQNGPARL